jgi:hypothetical protein
MQHIIKSTSIIANTTYIVLHKNIANPSYMCLHLQYSQQETIHNSLDYCIYSLPFFTITARIFE